MVTNLSLRMIRINANTVSQSLSVRFSLVDLVFAGLADVYGQSLSMGGLGFQVYGVTLSQTLWVFSGVIGDGTRQLTIFVKKKCSTNQLLNQFDTEPFMEKC